MGDIADMMIEGNMCQGCGEILNGKGYPTFCYGCQQEKGVNEFGEPVKKKVSCPHCGKRVKEAGLEMHIAAVHPNMR